jgi:hypothetical protein
MRAFTSFICCLFLLGKTVPAGAAPQLSDRPIATPVTRTSSALWNVRVELLMVAMPQEKLLPLLPDLKDPNKSEGAVTKLLAAIERKEAILTGYPTLHVLDGDRETSETIAEKRYPTEFEPPTNSQPKGAPEPVDPGKAVEESPLPTAFETRNLGVSLEVEARVVGRGKSIRLFLYPQRTGLLGFDSYDAVRTASGKVVKVDQPNFFTLKSSTTLTVASGQYELVGVHVLTKPENYLEVFIVQAVATPVP